MWPTIFSLNQGLSILLTGIVIKIMDDSLDQDIDAILGYPKNPWADNTGTLPYALLVFSLACALDAKTSASLFLACFAVGMAGNLTAAMPSGLYGYQESLGILILGLFIFGVRCFASSVLIVLTIQILDDYLDYEKDWALKSNWSYVLGSVESLLLVIILFLTSLYMDFFKSVVAIASYGVIVFSLDRWALRNSSTKKEGLNNVL